MTLRLLQPDAVVLGHTLAVGAQVAVEDTRVRGITFEKAADAERLPGTLLPGFVDLQVNGAAGHSVGEADTEGLEQIARTVAQNGAVAFLPTLITCPFPALLEKVAAVAAWIGNREQHTGARPLGIHVEGPFLVNAGAHDEGALLDPTPERVQQLVEAGAGQIKLVTLAPSRPGAPTAVEQLRAAGITVALGHGEGDAGIADCVASGAAMATHLFNAMGTGHHRDPGMAYTIMDHPELSCGLILDGVHVHDVMVRQAWERIGVERFVLVTDCVSAMGMPDGEYDLDGMSVTLRDGTVRNSGGVLAGSALTMFGAAASFLRTIPSVSPWGLARVAATNPATVIGARDVGRIEPGSLARFTLLGEDGSLRTVSCS